MNSTALQLMAPSLWQAKINLTQERLDTANCQIEAHHDLAAVSCWLKRYEKKTTFSSYKKEAERFLLWCVYEKGLFLHQLKVPDFEAYFHFLQNPPLAWVAQQRAGKKGRKKETWRPFLGPLDKSSWMSAVRIINSLMNYLVNADYLQRNPIKLIKKSNLFKQESQQRTFSVRARILEQDEWVAIQQVIAALPDSSEKEMDYKLKVQLLFSLLYFLGLRIHEVANLTWSSLKSFEGQWSFWVVGKGEKLAELEVHPQLLSLIKIYRLQLNKLPLPMAPEQESILVSKKTGKPLQIRQLFGWVKAIGQLAAQHFKNEPYKLEKLMNLSPHWIRHKLASDLAGAGCNAIEIRDILRHESIQTTQIYMHTEKHKRREALQRIQLNIKPKLYNSLEAAKVSTELKISLGAGPLSKALEFERVIYMLESLALSGFKWQREEPFGLIMMRFKKLNAIKEAVEMVYSIDGLINEIQLENLKRMIIKEADIRMFSCSISIKRTQKKRVN